VDSFTKEAFAENLNTKFRLALAGPNTVELELTEVVGTISTPHQEQFSIFFRGPQTPFLPQGTYHLEQERIGELDLFIVPIGKQADGYLYEAVFNYALEGK
jgi:hypothetical protein